MILFKFWFQFTCPYVQLLFTKSINTTNLYSSKTYSREHSESTSLLPYLPSELLYGLVDIPAVLFIFLLSHISKQMLQRRERSHLSKACSDTNEQHLHCELLFLCQPQIQHPFYANTRDISQHLAAEVRSWLTRPCESGKACLKRSSKISRLLWPSCFKANLKFLMSLQQRT